MSALRSQFDSSCLFMFCVGASGNIYESNISAAICQVLDAGTSLTPPAFFFLSHDSLLVSELLPLENCTAI